MRVLLVCAAPTIGLETVVAEKALSSDLIVAVDGGAALCARAGVVPNAIVGDFDSVDAKTLDRLESSGVELVRYSPDKSVTDLDLALDFARDRGATSVTVCAAMSGRVDHSLAAVGSLLRAADLRPVFLEPAQRGWILSSRHLSVLDLDLEGSTFSVMALETGTLVSITGARWLLDRHDLAVLDSHGVSNRVMEGGARVVVHSGAALVVNPEISPPLSAF